MIVEDEPEKLLRRIRELRIEQIEALAAGTISAENVPQGYRWTTGYVAGLDKALDLVREVFRGWLPEQPNQPKQAKRNLSEY